MRPFSRWWCGLALLCSFCAASRGQSALNERVLVVYNSGASRSAAVASHYMALRGIPAANRCKISVSSTDVVARDEYTARIQAPLRKCLDAAGRRNILYIVLSYGTPYVLKLGERSFSLDQFVADVWDEFAAVAPGNTRGNQPYYADAQSQGNVYQAFTPLAAWRSQPATPAIYSVWRLDAATPELAAGLADKAVAAEKNGLSGRGCFDLQYGPISQVGDYGSASGDWDVHQSAELARKAGFEVIEDEQRTEFGTPPSAARCDGAALYAGWYSLNHYNDAFTWNPGAIGFHLDSASAMDPRGGTNWSANAVKRGITLTSGAVSEPYLEGLPHPDQVFLYLFAGANAGDALLCSTRWLKWMVVNIGDPLYRPFPQGVGPFRSQAWQDLALAIVPKVLAAGDEAYGIVALNAPAPPGGTAVALSSDRPDFAAVPSPVRIPEGSHGAKFPIATRDVDADETMVRISASAGSARRSNTLVLFPLLVAVTVSPATTLKGGATATGTVHLRHPAPPAGIAVALTGGNPALAGIPAEVRVPGGATSASFPIATRAVAAPSPAVVTASHDGASRTVTLTLTP